MVFCASPLNLPKDFLSEIQLFLIIYKTLAENEDGDKGMLRHKKSPHLGAFLSVCLKD